VEDKKYNRERKKKIPIFLKLFLRNKLPYCKRATYLFVHDTNLVKNVRVGNIKMHDTSNFLKTSSMFVCEDSWQQNISAATTSYPCWKP